eukprot:Nk52_evm1s77 gene=Nk52_evmTU1s77
MDVKERERMCEVVELLLTSGEPQLDKDLHGELKSLARKSDIHTRACFEIVFGELQYDNARARLSCFQIIRDFARRSKLFRGLLCSNERFPEFLKLTIGFDADEPLPDPAAAAKSLREQALRFVKYLNGAYGGSSRYISLGYEFLRDTVHVDFDNLEQEVQRDVAREEERRRRERVVSDLNEDKYVRMLKSFPGFIGEVEEVLAQVVSCYRLLFPEHMIFLESEMGGLSSASSSSVGGGGKEKGAGEGEASVENMSPDEFVRRHGLASRHYKLTINLGSRPGRMRVVRNEDNAAILDTLRESIALVGNRYLKNISEWLSVLVKVKANEEPRKSEHERVLKGLIDVKQKLTQTLGQYEEIEMKNDYELDPEERKEALNGIDAEANLEYLTSGEDSDFEEVESFAEPAPVEDDAATRGRMFPSAKWTEENGVLFDKSKRNTGDKRFHAGTESRNPKPEEGGVWKENSFISRRYDTNDPAFNIEFSSDYSPKVGNDNSEDGAKRAGVRKSKVDVGGEKKKYLPYVKPKRDSLPSSSNGKGKEVERGGLSSEKTPRQQVEGASGSGSSVKRGASRDVKGKGKMTKEELMKKAPVVQFGPDLEYWEMDKIPLNTNAGFEELRRFWSMNDGKEDEQFLPDSEAAKLRKRRVKFEELENSMKKSWACRAPLRSGKLCARRDKVNCPFHGKIVGRDNMGIPNGEDAEERAEALKRQEQVLRGQEVNPDELWKTMRDSIERETGVEMSVKRTTSGRKKRKTTNNRTKLEEMDKPVETSRNRLRRKVMNPSAMKRAAVTMDVLQEQKTRDKHSNTFMAL